MKYILQYKYFISLLFISIAIFTKVAHSIDSNPSQFRNEYENPILEKETSKGELPDEFGSNFWSTQTLLKRQDVINLIDPQDKEKTWSFVGMKAWPSQKKLYIVVACSIKETQDTIDDDQTNLCSNDIGLRNKIIVAVLEYDGSNLPKLIARPYIENVVNDTDSQIDSENIETLDNSAFDLKDDSDMLSVGNLQHLDFAHYQVNPQILAFGIRFEVKNMYPRGAPIYQSMTLSAIINGKVSPILKMSTHYLKDRPPF